MMIKNIIEATSTISAMPIEVSEISQIIVANGYQDNIIMRAVDAKPEKLRGVCHQYTTSPGVYVPPSFVSLIVYNQNLSLEWQRVACCKELVHICEKGVEKTSTQEAVIGLIDKLVGHSSRDDYSLYDYMAVMDRLGLYVAVGLLFPSAAREQAVSAVNGGMRSVSEIAEWVCLPEALVALALRPEWPDLLLNLLDMGEVESQ
jgi:hypothetical protein